VKKKFPIIRLFFSTLHPVLNVKKQQYEHTKKKNHSLLLLWKSKPS